MQQLRKPVGRGVKRPRKDQPAGPPPGTQFELFGKPASAIVPDPDVPLQNLRRRKGVRS